MINLWLSSTMLYRQYDSRDSSQCGRRHHHRRHRNYRRCTHVCQVWETSITHVAMWS